MSIMNQNETLRPSNLSCDGQTTVTISFDAITDITNNPTDIVLIMDRSGSISSGELYHAKQAAETFVNTIAEACGDPQTIRKGSRISLVSFAETATVDADLTTDVSELKKAINALSATGNTNHEDAFSKALKVFETQSLNNRKIMIMLTDGDSTAGGNPLPVTLDAKNQNIEIFVIGVGQLNTGRIKLWVSEPADKHTVFINDTEELKSLFEQIANQISDGNILNAKIKEVLHPDFKLVSVGTPTQGTVTIVDDRSFYWNIGEIKTTALKKFTLSFVVQHIGTESGVKQVSAETSYTDDTGIQVMFPRPNANVDCSGNFFVAEPCPEPKNITVGGCEDAVVVDAADTCISSLGRIIRVDARIKQVCPGKRVAVGVILTETDPDGTEYPRGIKTILVPEQAGDMCRDIIIKCISFVVPEALDVTGCPESMCNERKFNVRVMANYVDTDFVCCDVKNSD